LLIRTTTCDGGLQVGLYCDSCGIAFDSRVTGEVSASRLWQLACAIGWTASVNAGLARHCCIGCGTEFTARENLTADEEAPLAPRSTVRRPTAALSPTDTRRAR
jgi:hypothetical protein